MKTRVLHTVLFAAREPEPYVWDTPSLIQIKKNMTDQVMYVAFVSPPPFLFLFSSFSAFPFL